MVARIAFFLCMKLNLPSSNHKLVFCFQIYHAVFVLHLHSLTSNPASSFLLLFYHRYQLNVQKENDAQFSTKIRYERRPWGSNNHRKKLINSGPSKKPLDGMQRVSCDKFGGSLGLFPSVKAYQTHGWRKTKETKEPRDYWTVTKSHHELTKQRKYITGFHSEVSPSFGCLQCLNYIS